MAIFARCVFNSKLFNATKTARELRKALIEEYYEKIKSCTRDGERELIARQYRIALQEVKSYNDCGKSPPSASGILNNRKFTTDAWDSRDSGEKQRRGKGED